MPTAAAQVIALRQAQPTWGTRLLAEELAKAQGWIQARP